MVTDRQAVTACLHSCETVIVGLTVVGYTVKKNTKEIWQIRKLNKACFTGVSQFTVEEFIFVLCTLERCDIIRLSFFP